MGRIFGKNGIRGLAVTEITCELAIQIGRAAAKLMASPNGGTKILIARDIRHSADTIEAALCAGICSAGACKRILFFKNLFFFTKIYILVIEILGFDHI